MEDLRTERPIVVVRLVVLRALAGGLLAIVYLQGTLVFYPMTHVCDRCGETYDSSELNAQEKLVLDTSGQWKKETTYRCFACIKQDAFG